MRELHLRQLGFTYSACGLFTKNKEIIKKFKETWDSRYIYQKEPDKACFQHDMADTDFKDLTRRTAFDKIFCDKAFNIAKNPKDDKYQRGLASMIYKFVSKKTYATRRNKFAGSGIKNENISSKELAEWLHKPIIKKFKKRKVRSSFIYNK